MKNNKEKEIGPAPEKLESKRRLRLEDLIRDKSEENVRQYVVDLLSVLEANEPELTEILEARPSLDRRGSLAQHLVKIIQIRLEGAGTWYTATHEEFEASIIENALGHIYFMKHIDEVLKAKEEE